jgi:ubiquinone/menaquinone biosynthesis C-methylase UbiE
MDLKSGARMRLKYVSPAAGVRQEAVVGLYERVIFPRICDFLLGRPSLARYRREPPADAQGTVLEVGFGTGLNLPHYPAAVRRLTAVDPHAGMHQLALRRIRRSRIEVDRRELSGERLPFADGAFDCVVSTWTLCSIDGVGRALGEVCRVLRPGGRFLFLEHGLSPEPGVQM